MTDETNKTIALETLERAFNQGDLSVIDEYVASNGTDHQESPGTDFPTHLKEVITRLRTGFPDLHFEIHNILSEGEIVAFRSTMTGTHQGTLDMGMGRAIPATGRKVSVPHMHFLRFVDGKNVDLWHMWDMPKMMQQLGVTPQTQAQQN